MGKKPSKHALKVQAASKDRLLAEMMCIALLDPYDFVDDDGCLRPIGEIPEEARRAIGGVNLKEIFEGKGVGKVQTGWLKELKITSKMDAIKTIGKWCGYETPTVIENFVKTQQTVCDPIDIHERISMLIDQDGMFQ
jgi:hypothetical protein